MKFKDYLNESKVFKLPRVVLDDESMFDEFMEDLSVSGLTVDVDYTIDSNSIKFKKVPSKEVLRIVNSL